jgi:hypothetical protein
LKVQIQELKLENSEDLEEIRQWSSAIEGKLAEFEGAISERKHVGR